MIIFILVIILGALAAYTFFAYRKKYVIAHAFDSQLYTILIPQDAWMKDESQKKDLRNLIAVMEQFYAGMSSVRDSSWRGDLLGKPSFALELALPEVGEEIVFHAAVPKRWARTFEKQTNALFPQAKVEPSKDYNIFNAEGYTAGAILKLSRAPFYPLRTFRHLEADPMEIIATAFSKLQRKGEGAAFQIVVRPIADSKWQKTGHDAARFLREGKKPEKAMKEMDWKHQAAKSVETFAFGKRENKEKKDSVEKDQDKKKGTYDDEFIKSIEEKASHPGFEVNLRLLTSAETAEEADVILRELADAFLQFTESQGNSFQVRKLSGKALENMVYNFSFRLFNEQSAIYMSSDELSSVYHFPVGKFSAAKVKLLKAKEAEPPPGVPREGIVVGENHFRGETTPIHFQRDDRRRHMYVIGQTGTGKSTSFIEYPAWQDIVNGEGVCIIDPHGESIQKILGLIPRERAEDVIYFNPGDTSRPMGLNMLEYDSNYPEQKTFVVNELFSIFQKLYGAVPESMGPMFEQYFRNSTMLAIDDPSEPATLLEVERVMVDKQYRDYKLAKCSNIVVKTFWKEIAEKAGGEAALQNIVPYITSKFDVFLANEIMRPIIAQEKSAFDFRKVMDEQKILLINLSKGRLGELNSSMLGLIMVGKLLMAALSRVDTPQDQRKDFYLYIDEFQNVTTNSIATILSEARKYRLNMTIAHQFIGQLEEEIKKAVFGNVGSMAALRIGTEDAEFMEKQFAPVFSSQDLINLDNFNAYVKLLINGQTSRPFSMKLFAPPSGDQQIAEAIKQLSSLKYGRLRAEVEHEITTRHGAKNAVAV